VRRDWHEPQRRGTRLGLFAGIVVLATIGITVSVMASSMMTHRYPGPGSLALASAPEQISLYLAPSWKPGPGGERQDAFSKTNFNVKVGQQLRLTIDNRDSAIHSITAAGAGVNVVIQPGVHTYTLVVNQAGRFKWICAYACDPFSMGHVDYMQGYITAT
jgi:heme/copper-type cytochrome/quinol oxidase subunit 2